MDAPINLDLAYPEWAIVEQDKETVCADFYSRSYALEALRCWRAYGRSLMYRLPNGELTDEY